MFVQGANVLSFYGSKIISDRQNCFVRVQIVLVKCKLFWSDPNRFGQVQIRLFWNNFYNLLLSKMIWTL
jgi:hypothetical protein